MAELVDAPDSGSGGSNPVEVQVLFWAVFSIPKDGNPPIAEKIFFQRFLLRRSIFRIIGSIWKLHLGKMFLLLRENVVQAIRWGREGSFFLVGKSAKDL